MKLVLMALVAGASWGLLACGGSDGSQEPSMSTAAAGMTAVAAPKNNGATCVHGDVFLVGDVGGVGFSARCATAIDRPAPVSVALAISSPGVRPGGLVRSYRTRATLTGDGQHTKGSCSLQRDVLGCDSRGSGEFALSGRFRVRAADRCAIEVTMSAPLPARCNADSCLANLKSRVLYKGQPSGCPGSFD